MKKNYDKYKKASVFSDFTRSSTSHFKSLHIRGKTFCYFLRSISKETLKMSPFNDLHYQSLKILHSCSSLVRMAETALTKHSCNEETKLLYMLVAKASSLN